MCSPRCTTVKSKYKGNGEREAERELLLINSVSLFLNVIGVSWLYSALEEYGYIASRTLIFKVISIVFIYWKQYANVDSQNTNSDRQIKSYLVQKCFIRVYHR